MEEKQEALLASHVALTKAEESVSFGKRMLEERSRAEKSWQQTESLLKS